MLSLQTKAILALIIAAALSFAMWSFGERRYHAGEAHIQAAWDAEKATQTKTALEAEQAHRATEQALQSNFHEIQNAYEHKIASDAVLIAGNGAALDGLRQRLAANSAASHSMPASPGNRSSADDEAAQLRRDIESCASEYQQLGTEAAGYSRQVEALQTDAMDLRQRLNGE